MEENSPVEGDQVGINANLSKVQGCACILQQLLLDPLSDAAVIKKPNSPEGVYPSVFNQSCLAGHFPPCRLLFLIARLTLKDPLDSGWSFLAFCGMVTCHKQCTCPYNRDSQRPQKHAAGSRHSQYGLVSSSPASASRGPSSEGW